MADEAHKEPTMEEILSSIRKIISEDDTPSEEVEAAPATPDISAVEAVNDDFEDLGLEDVTSENDLAFGDDFEEEDIFEATETFEDTSFDDVDDFAVELDDTPAAEPVDFAEPFSPEPVEAAEEPTMLEPVAAVAAAAPAARPEPAPRPTPVTQEEPNMAASLKYDQTTLTDERTADAAAGALGQLISKMDMGGDNTIEGLVRELLKPMIKEWLDSNLPGIVEEKVEAEVQRIARMAR